MTTENELTHQETIITVDMDSSDNPRDPFVDNAQIFQYKLE